ncbi:MAG TPA: two-component regulator propeller domain-containing protein, partial [Vicinamibacterales bacterium]|nr:two-component regulator propeller domain-containing protein [Vicinamibacterales bacterium]
MRSRIAKRSTVRFALTSMLSAWWSFALALDPALDMSQYGHTSWKIRDGFPKDTVTSFAQTADGYLWLGTSSGLLRFDGVRSVAWQAPAGTSLPDNRIRALLAARDGTLWIGTMRGLASWREGRLATYPQLNRMVFSLAEDQEDTVWVGVSNPGMLCAIRGINTECHGDDGRFGAWAGSFYEDNKGALWATSENGVWRWRPGAPVLYSLPALSSFQALSETATGAILAVTRNGLRQIADDKVTTFPIPSPLERMEPSTVFRDRDGTLWSGTQGQGLFHIHDERVDKFARVDGLSGDTVGRLFEDHEGNIWVTTNEGVDRFRALAAATYSVGQGLPGLGVSVLADRDGGMWVVTAQALHRWHDRRMTAYRGRSDRASTTA